MLRITVTGEEDRPRITVEGELTGDLARVLKENWETAASLRKSQAALVDLRGVTCIDRAGKEVLGLMIDDGAEFVVSGPKTAYLIQTLRAEHQADSKGART